MSDPRMDALRFRGVDLCAPESHDDPWELYDYLREHDPLYWDEHNELWYAFRYDDVPDRRRIAQKIEYVNFSHT